MLTDEEIASFLKKLAIINTLKNENNKKKDTGRRAAV